MITAEHAYWLCGLVVGYAAWRILRNPAHPARWGSGAFWMLLALTMILGSRVPAVVTGWMVVAMAALAAGGWVRRGPHVEAPPEERAREAGRLGNRVFLPTLLLPAVLAVGSLYFGRIGLAPKDQATTVAIAAASVVAFFAALGITRAPLAAPMREGGRLLEAVGWAIVLPQSLAALGTLFTKAGVGAVVADGVRATLPMGSPFVAVVAYCLGMALFTMVLGNAFAAFAVITGGIGLPFIVLQHGGNPAIMAALGMLAGYCGTLCTPMAANFNLVPALLLELDDKYAVIKAQLPIALAVWLFNALAMWLLVYRF